MLRIYLNYISIIIQNIICEKYIYSAKIISFLNMNII